MNLVCFGQQSWDTCWTGKQQLMTRIASRGHRVLYVDPDWDSMPPARAIGTWPSRAGSEVEELVPGRLARFTYRFAPPLGWKLNQRRYLHHLQRLVQTMHYCDPIAIALRPDVGPAMDVIAPIAKVYYAVDEWTAFGGLRERDRTLLRASEEELLRRVDLALAVSPRLLERFRQLQPRSFLLENGADNAHFAPERALRLRPHPATARMPRPRICYIGQVDDRIDFELLREVAAAHPEWHIALVGRVKSGTDISPIASSPNGHLLGYLPYEELPAILRDADVCIVPYRHNELTESCDPLKVYDYLAAGKPVVATPLEGLRACREAVVLARGATAFAAAVEAAIANPNLGRARRLALARRHDWGRRVDALLGRLAEAAAGSRLRPPERPPPGVRGSALALLPGDPEDYDDYGFRSSPVAIGSRAGRWTFQATRALGRAYFGLRLIGRLIGGRPARVRRILVVRHTYLGDLAVFIPALQVLRDAYPDARIVLGVQKGMSIGALVAAGGPVDAIEELDFLAGESRWEKARGLACLLAEGYDAVLLGLGYFLREEAFFAGAPHMVGIYNGHAWQRLLTRALPLDTTEHEVDCNVRLVEMLTGRRVPVPTPRVFVDEAAGRAGLATLLERFEIPPDAPVLTIHAGARKPSRRWPAERFATVVRTILAERPDLHAVFTGVAAERLLVSGILATLPPPLASRAHNAAAQTEIPILVALLRHSLAALCNDSGVMHLARTVGTPLLALLGPENDLRWGPYRLGPGPATVLRFVVPCARCSRKTCELHMCMRSLEPDVVLHHLRALLASDTRRIKAAHAGHGAPRLLPVTFHRFERSFAELAAAGYALPLVSVAMVPPALAAPLLGCSAFGAAAADAARDLTDPSYPRIEVLRLATAYPRGSAAAAAPGGVILPADDRAQAWRSLLGAVSGDLLALSEQGASWAPNEIADHVAALLRQPLAIASVSRARGDRPPARGLLRLAAIPSLVSEWTTAAAGRSAAPLLAHLARRHVVMHVATPIFRGWEQPAQSFETSALRHLEA